MLTKLFYLSIVLFVTKYVVCDDIFGCGGFVKSSFGINFSRVEIKLYTKQGSLKYHTDCAPHNGYYLIPLYDKGDYVLKIEPPTGWSFEPSSVPLHVDGKTDPCSTQQDINFTFKGFTLSGQVLSRGTDSGPAGILLKLKNANGILKEMASSEGGHYHFSELSPGTYIVEASHSSWVFDKSSEEVEIVDDNLKTGNKIVISGYDVTGFVFSDGQPIKGVHFLLFSSNSATGSILGCKAEQVKGFSQKLDFMYLCHVTSSEDGKFLFPSLPPAKYTLVPFYKGEHIEFDVSPPKLDFTVTEGSLLIKGNFLVQGFSVSGWIGSGPKGRSLPDASVYIDGQVHGVSDVNGIYHLENMRAGTYHLDIKKAYHVFESKEMKINPNTPRLPDIYVSKYSVCGRLEIDEYPKGLEKDPKSSLLLKAMKGSQEIVLSVDDNGSFCVDAAPGKYELEPKVSEMEASYGLKFVPNKFTVEVANAPVLNILFRQFRAEVKGKVKCIEKCEGLELELSPVSFDYPHLKATVGPEGNFQFEKCLPGNYVLSIIKEEWCFQSKTIKITISDQDVFNLELLQTGFQAMVALTHASTFKVKYPSGEFHDVELQKSKNMLCLPEKGVYEFIPVGCHLYKKDSFKFDTSNPSELSLAPVKHLVTGSILTEVNVTDIKLFVKEPNSNEVIIPLQEPLDKKANYYRYTFSLFFKSNTELHLRITSKTLLFRPSSTVIQVGDDCMENAIEIMGKNGQFLNGSVTPAITGVTIKVYLKATDELYTETVTDDKGAFLIGPLEDESDYNVVAETEGYVFTALDAVGNFAAFKLAEIVVTVKAESGEPLQGVLLSLTGGAEYRKNSVTQKNGKLSFIGLGPGQYFLRSMLKEYKFDPPSKMIDIKEGTQVSVEISGTRVAYSLFGSATSLTGEAEVGVAVEAVSVPTDACDSHLQEEAVSEQGGAFRIRGLLPDCEYVLRLKPGAEVNQHIERSAPREIRVKVNHGDIIGVRLIVFRYYGQLDVSGNIITSQEYLPTLKIRLYREEAPDQIIHSLSMSQSSFFYLPLMTIDKKNYILQLETSLSPNSYFLEHPSVTFCANTTFHHFTLNFSPRVKSLEQEVTQGSVLALPVAIIAIILVYNYSKLLPLLGHVPFFLSSLVSPGKVQVVASDSVPGESANVKKKTKPKRIQ